MEFLTGFESTHMPLHGADVLALTRHDERWYDDLCLVRDTGITRLRYPIPWHRIETVRGHYDWAWIDEVLAGIRDLGLTPIVDPLHHTSFPAWLVDGFANPEFPTAYRDFCAAFAARFPWVRQYTIFNEPLPTTLLCTEFGVWYPALRHETAFYRVVVNVARAICEATRAIQAVQPAACFIHVDTAEHHGALDADSEPFARELNERRFLYHDLLLGRVTEEHFFYPRLRRHADIGDRELAWFREHAAQIDVLGLDYYAHCEHQFHRGGSIVPSQAPRGFAAIARDYWERYRLPLMLTETNIRGFVSDRISWLKYMVEQCEALVAAEGIPFEGFTWFPFIDSTDWDSLLGAPRGHIDPVGLYWLRQDDLSRRDSELVRLYRRLARGEARGADLPAYHFLPPLSEQLAGFQPQWQHWAWREPSVGNLLRHTGIDVIEEPARARVERRPITPPVPPPSLVTPLPAPFVFSER